MRVNGCGVSIGVASMWLLAAMPSDAHTGGERWSDWWSWFVSHQHGGPHGGWPGSGNHGGHNGGGHGGGDHGGHNGGGHGGGDHGGHNGGGHGGGNHGGHNGGGHGGHHGGGDGGSNGGGNGCPPSGSAGVWSGGQCTGNSSSWSNSANWGAGRAPSGATAVAEFGASRVTTIDFDTTSTLGTLLFNANALAYSFNIGSPYTLTLADAGIRNLSAATQTVNVSGRLNFVNGASAGNAALSVAAGGIVDFSGVTSGIPTAGSLAGAGTVYLGRNTLAIGGLNTSTTFSGSIADGNVRGGSLQKTGTGTLTFTGVNTFSGATLVAGQLTVTGSGRIDGTSNVTIANLAADSGTLRVAGAQARVTTPGNVIVGNSGRGTLTLEDSGTLTTASVMLGANSGASGTLNLGSGGTAGVLSAASVVGGSGTGSAININHSQASYTLSSNLLGSLALNQNGTGTTTLTGTNSYSGGTYLNAGTLRVSANTQLGGTTAALNFNGGALQAAGTITNFTHPMVLNTRGGTIDTGTFSMTASGAISGAGRLTKTGSGTLTLTGASTYTGGTTVSAGTLRGTTANLVGSITNNGAVAFLQTTDGIYSGVMSGSGTLNKLNGGSLTLSGANTFTGGTTVSSGALLVTGSLASAVTVGESGTLGGTGTIRAPLTISGVLAPGVGGTGVIGTLTVANRVTFNAGSLYRVDAEASGRADRLDASGAVTIDSATVEVIANPSGTWEARKSYTIISSGSGVTGQFSDVSTDLAFLTPSLSYDRSNVYLTLERNDTSFNSVTKTRRQSVTAKYLQTLDAGPANNVETSTVLDKVTASSAAQARTTFDQISGTDLTRASRVTTSGTSKVVDVLVRHFSGTPGAAQGLWMQNVSTGADGLVREDAAGSRHDWRSNGVVTGFDAAVSDDTLLGVSVSHTRSSAMLNDRRDAYADVETPRTLLYASTNRDSIQLSGVAAFARPVYRTQRQLTYLGSEAATASHAAREVSMYAEVASVSRRGEAQWLQPLMAVRYVRAFESSYVESGNVGRLAVQGRTAQVLTSELGTRYFRQLRDGSIELRATWSRSYADTFSNLSARLANDASGETFAVSDESAARDHVLVDLELTTRLPGQFSLRVEGGIDAPLGAPLRKQIGIGFERTW